MMAVASTNHYTRGSLLSTSDEDWYHGELTRVEAEQALAASDCDCFLIRESEGGLVLSLTQHGQVHHVAIKYGPGWYELEGGSAQHRFTELDDLVSYYHRNPIRRDLKITLGLACVKIATENEISSSTYETPSTPIYHMITNTNHHYDAISEYSKGVPVELTKHDWFYGEMTEEQVERVLSCGNDNRFLVRQLRNSLILSSRILGWRHCYVIKRSPTGYYLEGKDMYFKNISEMLTHYKKVPIDENDQVLGTACDRKSSGLLASGAPNEPSIPVKIFIKETHCLNVTWSRKAILPLVTSSPQIVLIGDHVYVGGGFRINADTKNTVFKYSIQNDTWETLPYCQHTQFGLSTLNGELIVIGGLLAGKATNLVYTFRDGAWVKLLPPMPTSRYLFSTVSHENRYIIAAGGRIGEQTDGRAIKTDVVEIYDHNTKQWYNTIRLPSLTYTFTTCIIGGMCYKLGGTGTTETMYVSLSSLNEDSVPADSTYSSPQIRKTWNVLKGLHPLIYTSLVEIGGTLTAMGGSYERELRRGTRYISTYDFTTDTWMECEGAQLPVPLYRPGVVKLDDNRLMVIGGQPKMQQFSNQVYIGTYNLST